MPISTNEFQYLIQDAVGVKVSDPLVTKSFPQVRVHVYAGNGEDAPDAVITLEQSVDGKGWLIVATVTNPTQSGEMYVLDSAPLTRANISRFNRNDVETINVVAERPE